MAQRLYGLFEVTTIGDRKTYTRIYPELAYRKEQAVRIFQSALLAPYMTATIGMKPRELRPIKAVVNG
jgi:hypothetical protein